MRAGLPSPRLNLAGRSASLSLNRVASFHTQTMSQDPRGMPGAPRGTRPPPARPTRATYWRRRVMVLAVGLGLLTALGWGVNALLAARPTQAALTGNTTATGSAHAHHHSRHLHPAASPSPRPSPTRSRHRKAARHPAGRVLACTPGGVTLSLSSPQWWYQAGATPQFTVRARAHGQPCRFTVSSTSVSVVVTAAGHHIWSSADCASGGSRVVVLTGARPAVILRTSWDRKRSAPGCTGTSRLVPPGEYKVTAVAGHLHSGTTNLVLGAKGAIGP
jgi:hypothetical protein